MYHTTEVFLTLVQSFHSLVGLAGTVYDQISIYLVHYLPKLPYTHCIYMVLANPTHLASMQLPDSDQVPLAIPNSHPHALCNPAASKHSQLAFNPLMHLATLQLPDSDQVALAITNSHSIPSCTLQPCSF